MRAMCLLPCVDGLGGGLGGKLFKQDASGAGDFRVFIGEQGLDVGLGEIAIGSQLSGGLLAGGEVVAGQLLA